MLREPLLYPTLSFIPKATTVRTVLHGAADRKKIQTVELKEFHVVHLKAFVFWFPETAQRTDVYVCRSGS